MEGWIKIERSIMEHWIFQDAEYFRAWVLLIMLANHEDKMIMVDRKPKLIRRGSFFTSISKLSARLGWDRRKTARYIDALKKDGMVTTDGTTHGTTLTIVKYDFYQGGRATDGTTNGTADGTADGTQTRMIKNDKNKRNSARAREGTSERGPVRKTTFHNFQERHTDYDALFGGR